MSTVWKLTDFRGKTRNNTHWEIGTTHHAQKEGTQLCTSQVIHVYEHPVIGFFMNPVHAEFERPRLWEGEGIIVSRDPLKAGVKLLTIKKELPTPKLTNIQRIAFGILCFLEVEKSEKFREWANDWLQGIGRTTKFIERVTPLQFSLDHMLEYDPAREVAYHIARIAGEYKGINFGSLAERAIRVE